MTKNSESPSLNSVRAKIVVAFLLSVVAFGLFWWLSQNSFKKIRGTVEKITTPNPKLALLNSLYYDISSIDNMRGIGGDGAKKTNLAFIDETKRLVSKIDSLRMQGETTSRQDKLLDSMETILLQRDKYFLAYLRARTLFFNTGPNQVNELMGLIEQSSQQVDSNIKKTRLKETRTTRMVRDTVEEKEKGLMGWLFGKKKIEIKYVPETTTEQETSIDSLTTTRQDSALAKLEEAMRDIEKDRYRQSIRLLNKEIELMRVNKALVNQFLLLLETVRAEELSMITGTNREASHEVSAGVNRIIAVSVFFFLLMGGLIFFIFSDIAKSNKYRKQLIVAKAEAERLGQVKQRFLANMSHEIRTPLQSILGYAEQLKSKPDDKAVNAVYQSAEYLHQIVNEILDYSKIISGKYTIEHKSFSVLEVINEVAEAARVQAYKKGLELVVTLSGTMQDYVTGDAFRLKQVLFNLLGNAIKFTADGSVQLTVQQQINDTRVVQTFEVSDTGPGIAPQDIDTMFNMFEQGGSSLTDKQAGTGLGLSIVKELVELQGGTIRVLGGQGKGAVFTVCIPYTIAEAGEQEGIAEEVLPLLTEAGKALFVDDDPFILGLCKTIAEKYDIKGIYSSSPEEILNSVWDNAIEVAFLDIRMPKVNGATLCAHIRKTAVNPVKIYALTAQAMEDEQENILKKGFDGILIKPFKEDLIAQLLSVDPKREKEVEKEHFWLLKKMTGNNNARMHEILDLYLQETEADSAVLGNYHPAQQPAIIKEALHRLAGRTGQLGASGLSKQLRKTEKLFDTHKENAIEQLQEVIKALHIFQEEVALYMRATAV